MKVLDISWYFWILHSIIRVNCRVIDKWRTPLFRICMAQFKSSHAALHHCPTWPESSGAFPTPPLPRSSRCWCCPGPVGYGYPMVPIYGSDWLSSQRTCPPVPWNRRSRRTGTPSTSAQRCPHIFFCTSERCEHCEGSATHSPCPTAVILGTKAPFRKRPKQLPGSSYSSPDHPMYDIYANIWLRRLEKQHWPIYGIRSQFLTTFKNLWNLWTSDNIRQHCPINPTNLIPSCSHPDGSLALNSTMIVAY